MTIGERLTAVEKQLAFFRDALDGLLRRVLFLERQQVESQLTELLTVKEAADFLKVKERFLYKRIRAGKLKPVKVGGRNLRIRKSDLLAFIDRRDD